eukprot:TRINITY_DN14948_c0_g1_i1.p1 TRINITY_DN14948_c0_g1~~TRINITY_DN14948_c0_g1_i1.p1  ORF type:complete len:116 (+),score=20.66 TRINITY_DN14948_c0_g1_i1:57-404(+)
MENQQEQEVSKLKAAGTAIKRMQLAVRQLPLHGRPSIRAFERQSNEDVAIIKPILVKPAKERSSTEVECLLKIMNRIPFFKNVINDYGIETLRELTKNLTYELYQEETMIFDIGT